MAVRDRIMFAKLFSEYTWGVSFEKAYDPDDDMEKIYADFYELAKSVFDRLEIPIEYCALGDGRAHYKRFTDKKCEQRLVKVGSALTYLSLANMIEMPDWNLRVGMGHNTEGFNHVSLGFTMFIREKFIADKPDFLPSLMKDVAALTPWDYGYAIRRKYSKEPERFLLAFAYYSANGIKKEEKRLMDIWDKTSDADRKKKIRDIFEYNVLNRIHKEALLAVMPDLQTALTKLPNDLFLLKTDKSSQKKLREKLQGTGVLVY